jgi:hypothetical protein
MPVAAAALDTHFLLAATRRLHESIRERVSALLEEARAAGRPELASRPGAWGAGDVAYAIDEAAEHALAGFAAEVGQRHPLTLIAEGPGVSRHGENAYGAALHIIADPVDGTRGLMHDMRSAYAITGIARDHGRPPRLSDIEIAVQTELPTTSAGVYHVLSAVFGQGATITRHDVRTGAEIDSRPLRASEDPRIDNGYLCFTRYLPVERPLIADVEQRFLARAIEAHGLDPRMLYDDQYLCTSGQLHLVTTGRYRMLADLRGWLFRTRGLVNFTAKPYDLAALLVYEEAGVPVLDDSFAALDAPLDTETRMSVIAFANEGLRQKLETHLRAAMEHSLRGGLRS